MQFSEHQILFANHPELDDLVQLAQGADHSRIFLVGLVAVVGFHDPKLGNGLGVDIAGEKTKPSRGSHELVLVLAGWLTDNPQAFSAVLHGYFLIRGQSLLNGGSSIAAGVGKLHAVDLKEKTQGVFMNVHRDIDNVIQVDFLGRSRNLHNGFSFLGFDSTGYELLNSYCTSALEGEAFLLAA